MTGILRGVSGNRFVRFAGIGVVCLSLVHAPVLGVMVWLGIVAVLANAIGFMASTVVNYFLQRRFNFSNSGNWISGLGKYLGTSLGSLLVNSLVFQVVYVHLVQWYEASIVGVVTGATVLGSSSLVVREVHFLASPLLVSAFTAAVAGTVFNFLAARRIVFQSSKTQEAEIVNHAQTAVSRSALLEVRARVRRDGGIAFFVPAWNEEGNLANLVREVTEFFQALDWPLTFTIVDDGSTDDTAMVAEELAASYPEVVRTVHHPSNQGYGAGLRSGFLRSLGDTSHPYIAFFDGDRQFFIGDLLLLVQALVQEEADFAVGHRVDRADPWPRRITGGFWQWGCRSILGVTASDTDCGFKVFRRSALAKVAPQLRFNRGAAGNAELFARAARQGLVFVERPVRHRPRNWGKSTGVDPIVVFRSGLDLLHLRLELWRRTLRLGGEYAPAGVGE